VIQFTGNSLLRDQYSESDLFVTFYRGDLTEVLRAATHSATGTPSDELLVTETASGHAQDASDTRNQFTSGGHETY
jgi:hypothetical protein